MPVDLYQARTFVMSGKERTITDPAHAPSSTCGSPPWAMNFPPNGSNVACTRSRYSRTSRCNTPGWRRWLIRYAVISNPQWVEIATPLPNGIQPSWLSDFVSWPVAGRGVLAFGPIARGRAQQQLAGVYVVSLL